MLTSSHLLSGVLAGLVNLSGDGPQLRLGELPARLSQHLQRLRKLHEGRSLQRGRGRRSRRLGLGDLGRDSIHFKTAKSAKIITK